MDTSTQNLGLVASSVDSSKVSLTVESGTKVILGLAAFYAASKGMNVDTATTQAQALIDVAASGVAAAVVVYHSIQTLYGMVRKVYVAMFAKK